jgi:hypothetical protein
MMRFDDEVREGIKVMRTNVFDQEFKCLSGTLKSGVRLTMMSPHSGK